MRSTFGTVAPIFTVSLLEPSTLALSSAFFFVFYSRAVSNSAGLSSFFCVGLLDEGVFLSSIYGGI